MVHNNPKLIALQFTQFINNQDIQSHSSLMSENHCFID